MIERIIKRDGREVPFEIDKISTAIYKAAEAIGGHNRGVAEELAKQVEDYIEKKRRFPPLRSSTSKMWWNVP